MLSNPRVWRSLEVIFFLLSVVAVVVEVDDAAVYNLLLATFCEVHAQRSQQSR